VEAVMIPAPSGRLTVCISSQVGCAMNCQFCFTGRMGLRGNLTTEQIVEQVCPQPRARFEFNLVSRHLSPLSVRQQRLFFGLVFCIQIALTSIRVK
jgi:hypothetical protein